MFLNLDATDCQLRLVFELAKELEKNPERVKLTQALTLNRSKPLLGLKGKHGLFGSTEWWDNIKTAFGGNRSLANWWKRLTKGQMKVEVVSGIIERTYFAGQDARWGNQVNSFTLRLEDGSTIDESIYPKLKSDRKLFLPGAKVLIAYVLDELKRQPAHDGTTNYSRIVLEMAVSKRSVAP